jgi:hypothetical protein
MLLDLAASLKNFIMKFVIKQHGRSNRRWPMGGGKEVMRYAWDGWLTGLTENLTVCDERRLAIWKKKPI